MKAICPLCQKHVDADDIVYDFRTSVRPDKHFVSVKVCLNTNEPEAQMSVCFSCFEQTITNLASKLKGTK